MNPYSYRLFELDDEVVIPRDDGDITVSAASKRVYLDVPGERTALTVDQAQKLVRALLDAVHLAMADGEQASRTDSMMPVFSDVER